MPVSQFEKPTYNIKGGLFSEGIFALLQCWIAKSHILIFNLVDDSYFSQCFKDKAKMKILSNIKLPLNIAIGYGVIKFIYD